MRNFASSKPTWARCLRLAAAGSMSLCVGGCLTSGTISPPSPARTLPEAPAFARPVKVAPPKVGEDVLLVAARERAGRAKANDIIACFDRWYAAVKDAYGQVVAEQTADMVRKTCRPQTKGK